MDPRTIIENGDEYVVADPDDFPNGDDFDSKAEDEKATQ